MTVGNRRLKRLAARVVYYSSLLSRARAWRLPAGAGTGAGTVLAFAQNRVARVDPHAHVPVRPPRDRYSCVGILPRVYPHTSSQTLEHQAKLSGSTRHPP